MNSEYMPEMAESGELAQTKLASVHSFLYMGHVFWYARCT